MAAHKRNKYEQKVERLEQTFAEQGAQLKLHEKFLVRTINAIRLQVGKTPMGNVLCCPAKYSVPAQNERGQYVTAMPDGKKYKRFLILSKVKTKSGSPMR